MNIQPKSSWRDFTAVEPALTWGRRQGGLPRSPRYLFFGVLGTFVAINSSMLFAVFGIGMSQQPVEIAFNAALASLLAIIMGFVIIRRLISFPLLRTYGYVALTFVSSFTI